MPIETFAIQSIESLGFVMLSFSRSILKVWTNEILWNFRFTLENVSASGKIGLVIKEDSFLPQTYDMHYEPNEVLLRVSFYHN